MIVKKEYIYFSIQYRNTFDEFTIFYVKETSNCEEIETLFKQEMKVKNLLFAFHYNLF